MNKFEYKNLTPFKWFVLENFPFIEADFDALTEWQLFCKLGKELNKIINSTNILGTQVETLTDYVKNYFDNLDVQEEINNKLNEMAEDGTLQEIITSYLNVKGILAFNTVLDMKNATNIVDGSFVKTYGNLLYNDGKGEFYKIRQIINTDVVDNVNIISLKNPNLVAELIPNYEIEQLKLYKTNIDELHQKRLQAYYNTSGTFEKGVCLSAWSNPPEGVENARPEVQGIRPENPQVLATYVPRDSVGLFVRCDGAKPLINYINTDTEYTSTTLYAPTIDEIYPNLKYEDVEGCIIDTYGSSNNEDNALWFSGLIKSYNPETKTFEVYNGWYGAGTDGTKTYLPINGTKFYIGFNNKVYGANIVAIARNNATALTGMELQASAESAITGGKILDLVGSASDKNGNYLETGCDIHALPGSKIGYAYKYNRCSQKALSGYMETANNKYIVQNFDVNTKEETYFVKSNGRSSALRLQLDVISNVNTKCPKNDGIFVFTFSQTSYNWFATGEVPSGSIYILINYSGHDITFNFTDTTSNTQKSFTLTSNQKAFVCNLGNSWTIL